MLWKGESSNFDYLLWRSTSDAAFDSIVYGLPCNKLILISQLGHGPLDHHTHFYQSPRRRVLNGLLPAALKVIDVISLSIPRSQSISLSLVHFQRSRLAFRGRPYQI